MFQQLIQSLAIAQSEAEVRSRFMDSAGQLFHAHHWSLYLKLDTGQDSIDLKGLPDSFIDYYRSYGHSIDCITQHVLKFHAPVHEQILFTEAEWKQTALYREGCGIQYNHEHVLAGAIVGQGQLIGTAHFSRDRGQPAFDHQDLAVLSALCAHLSATLAVLRTQNRPEPVGLLTARELQIAELVAKGLTNAEIGAELWITQNSVKQALKRIFRKLEISARTELVARIANPR
jgi:DNA-binding CsgD family transcriptional regulator